MTSSARRVLMICFAVVAISACSSNGCSCVAKIKGGFPVAERHESAIQLRASAGLFSYLQANAKTVLNGLLPGMGTFNVPPSCGGSNKICCGTPQPTCQIEIKPQALVTQPTPPNQLHVVLTTQLISKEDIPVEFNAVVGTAKCLVGIDTTMGTAGHTDIDIDTTVTFPVDKTTDLTGLQAGNTAINNLDASMLTLKSQPGDFLCTIANFGPIKSFVISQLQSQLVTQLDSTINGQTCMKCMDKTDCNSFASDCKSGVCVGSDGMTCIQEVGLDGRMDVGSLLKSFSPSTQAGMDILAALGGYASADTGLSLGMLGGGVADPHSSCVPMVPEPAKVTVPMSKTFSVDTAPDGSSFMLGIGVHVSHLDQLGWAAFDGGALCLDVGTPQVAQLDAKTISVIVPSLQDLTHGGDAPMYLVIRPTQPPTFKLGKGTFKMDMNGMTVIDDPLLNITIPGFVIDFYAFVDEHYVRVLTLTSDLLIPMGLEVDAMGRIQPVLGDLSKAFTNVSVTNTDLLTESPDDLAKAFPTLLGVAVGQLSSALKPIALPALMGLNIKPKIITSTDPNSEGVNQFLSIFADLAATTTQSITVHTQAQLQSVTLPATRNFAVDRRLGEPVVNVAVGASTDGQPLEYAWQLDGAGWSPWSQTATLVVRHPLLWLQGHHALDVRARVVGAPDTADGEAQRLDVIVDTIAPTVKLERMSDGEVRFVGDDNVTKANALLYRFRTAQSDFGAWTSVDHAAVPEDAEVQVRDEAGNIGSNQLDGRTTLPPSAGCGSCALGGAPTGSGEGALVVVALVGLLLYRRRAGVVAVLFLVGTVSAGCADSAGEPLTKGDLVNPVDEVGRYHDVAVSGGTFQLSAYDDSVGDLVYARFNDPTQPIQWEDIDGIDPNATVDTPGGYRNGISDPGPDVGLYTSIALTQDGKPRISYYDNTNSQVKLALGPKPWRTVVVDSSTDPNVKVGLYTALSLDGNDVPSIAYLVTGISDGSGGFKSELRLATAMSSDPSDGQFTITTVDSTRIRCAGLCPAGTACIQTAMVNGMPNGDPSISTCVPTTNDCTSTMCTTAQACIMGTCTTMLATPKAPDWVEGTGLFTRTLRINGALNLVYYDRSQGDLKLAVQQSNGSFQVSFIDGNDPATDVGQFATAAADSQGTLYVAYQDVIHDQLLFKTVQGGTAEAMPEVIDDGMRSDGPHPVGEGAALILDGGNPRVVYQDQQLSDLLEGQRSSGTWSHQSLDNGEAGYGWYNHLVSNNGQIWVTQFVYDRQNGQSALGQLQLSTLP